MVEKYELELSTWHRPDAFDVRSHFTAPASPSKVLVMVGMRSLQDSETQRTERASADEHRSFD